MLSSFLSSVPTFTAGIIAGVIWVLASRTHGGISVSVLRCESTEGARAGVSSTNNAPVQHTGVVKYFSGVSFTLGCRKIFFRRQFHSHVFTELGTDQFFSRNQPQARRIKTPKGRKFQKCVLVARLSCKVAHGCFCFFPTPS